MKTQINLNVSLCTADNCFDRNTIGGYFVSEFIDDLQFVQSWGPYTTAEAANNAAYHLSTLEFFLGAEVTVTPLLAAPEPKPAIQLISPQP